MFHGVKVAGEDAFSNETVERFGSLWVFFWYLKRIGGGGRIACVEKDKQGFVGCGEEYEGLFDGC